MAHAAVIATQLQAGLTPGLYSLTLDGLNIIDNPANSYGVDPSTVTIVEAGPGDVSSMTFVIDDTLSSVTVSPGQGVLMWDLGLDVPLFCGFVESYSIRDFGLGRSITVQCVGIEAVLDWLYVPSLTFPVGWNSVEGWQYILSMAYSIGVPLNAARVNSFSTVDHPVGDAAAVSAPSAFTLAGGSLRQVLEAYRDAFAATAPAAASFFANIQFTVDYWSGLRVFQASFLSSGLTVTSMTDHATVTVTTAADPRPSDTEHRVGSAAARQAIVTQGANVTRVLDGSGIPGPFVSQSSADATTEDGRVLLGTAMLNGQGPAYNGQTTLSMTRAALATAGPGTATAQRRPGSQFVFTEPNVGVSGLKTFIQSIRKSFADSGEETWVITYGGPLRQSGAALIRKLTAGVFA